MSNPFVTATVSVNVRPSTMLVLKRARRLYESIACGEFKIYATKPAYKFHDPDLAIMRDTAMELKELIQDLEFRLKRKPE
jgi:hypothetical protein